VAAAAPRWAAGGPGPAARTRIGAGGPQLAAVNPPAEAAGLRVGMSLADARALAPALRAVAQDGKAEERAAAALRADLGRYSPTVGLDLDRADGGLGLAIDSEGCAHLFGGEAAMLDDMRARAAAFDYGEARVAAAPTLGAAWALARYGADDAARVDAPDVQATLDPLPVAALRVIPHHLPIPHGAVARADQAPAPTRPAGRIRPRRGDPPGAGGRTRAGSVLRPPAQGEPEGAPRLRRQLQPPPRDGRQAVQLRRHAGRPGAQTFLEGPERVLRVPRAQQHQPADIHPEPGEAGAVEPPRPRRHLDPDQRAGRLRASPGEPEGGEDRSGRRRLLHRVVQGGARQTPAQRRVNRRHA